MWSSELHFNPEHIKANPLIRNQSKMSIQRKENVIGMKIENNNSREENTTHIILFEEEDLFSKSGHPHRQLPVCTNGFQENTYSGFSNVGSILQKHL
jgi:hypothetical protein